MFISEVVYFTKAVKNPLLILRNYEYKVERKTAGRNVWCCKRKEKYRCKARCVTFGNVVQIRNGVHNHDNKVVLTNDMVSRYVTVVFGKSHYLLGSTSGSAVDF